MNISHNYSKLDDHTAIELDPSNAHSLNEHLPKCVDEETLRDLINIPSPLFMSKPDLAE